MAGKSRDPVAELVLKGRKAVLTARPALRGGSALKAIGKSTLMALDGREAEILRVPELYKDKFVDVVKSCVLRDKIANGPTKKRIKFFTTARNSNTATKKERGPTATEKIKTTGRWERSCTRHCATSWKTTGAPAKSRRRRACWGSVPSCRRPW